MQIDRGIDDSFAGAPASVTGVDSLGSAARDCADAENCRSRGSLCLAAAAVRMHLVQSMVLVFFSPWRLAVIGVMETRLGGFGGGSQNLARPGTCRLGQWGCGQRNTHAASSLLRMTSYSTATANLLHLQQEM